MRNEKKLGIKRKVITKFDTPTKKTDARSSGKTSPGVKNSVKKVSDPKNVVFCGDIFNNKDLIGNIFLQEAIERVSGGRYGKMFLAQNKV